MKNIFWSACLICCLSAAPALAEWGFSGSPLPNASIQTNNMTLELQCDRIRFAPAGYEDSQDIVRKNGLSFRFLINGSQEVAAFQMGRENAFVQIIDNYPVEIQFSDEADYAFVLDQIAANATLNLSMVDQDVSYGFFDLKGSGAAIRSLRAECRALDRGGSVCLNTVGGVSKWIGRSFQAAAGIGVATLMYA